MPKVSVVIPTYDRARFLPVAVRSVLKQTFRDFEILIVDDASTDDTEAVVAALRDARIKYVRYEQNKRIATARNTGVAHSAAEYIAFLDDDDEWLPDKLAKQVEVLDRSSAVVGAVYTAFAQIDLASEDVLGVVAPRKRGHILHELCMRNWIGTASTVCLRRECFEEVGLFDETIEFGEEYDMWIRIAHTFDFEYIDEVLVHYGVHANRLTTNYGVVISGLAKQLGKHGWFFAADRSNYSRRFSSLGTLYCYNHEVGKGRRAFAEAIKAAPLELNNYVFLALTLFGARVFTMLREPRGGVR